MMSVTTKPGIGNDPGAERLIKAKVYAWESIPELATMVEGWRDRLSAAVLAGGLSSSTVQVYLRALRPWLGWLAERRCVNPSTEDLAGFLEAFRDGTDGMRAHRPATMTTLVTALRHFSAYVRDAGGSHPDPPDGGSAPAPLDCAPPAIPVLTALDMATVIAAIPDHTPQGVRNRAMLGLLWSTGCRSDALRKATMSCYDRCSGAIRLLRGHHRPDLHTILLDERVRALMDAWLHRHPFPDRDVPLFIPIDRRGGARRASLSTLSIRRIALLAMRASGMTASAAGAGFPVDRVSWSTMRIRWSSVASGRSDGTAQAIASHGAAWRTRRAIARMVEVPPPSR